MIEPRSSAFVRLAIVLSIGCAICLGGRTLAQNTASVCVIEIPSTCFPQHVTYRDDSGQTVAEIEVTSFGSPEPLRPTAGYESPSGRHYVVIGVGIENSGTRPVTAEPTQFLIYNSFDGFIYAGLNLPAAAFPDRALLHTRTLQPKESTGGDVLFLVSDDDVFQEVFYQPRSDRLIPVADICNSCEGSGGRTHRTLSS
jgi:hypothetical protein